MNFTFLCMYRKRKLLVHVRKWECVQVGNAQVGRAQKIVRKKLCAIFLCASEYNPKFFSNLQRADNEKIIVRSNLILHSRIDAEPELVEEMMDY